MRRRRSRRDHRRTFLQVGDAVVQRGERGLHFVPLLAVVAGAAAGLLERVDAGQNLLLHVVDLVLQQVFEAVGLHRVVASAVLLKKQKKLISLLIPALDYPHSLDSRQITLNSVCVSLKTRKMR